MCALIILNCHNIINVLNLKFVVDIPRDNEVNNVTNVYYPFSQNFEGPTNQNNQSWLYGSRL